MAGVDKESGGRLAKIDKCPTAVGEIHRASSISKRILELLTCLKYA
jgi:hypothetical protein